MEAHSYAIYQCPQAGCRFRFPFFYDLPWDGTCPRCSAPAHQVAEYPLPATSCQFSHTPALLPPVEALLDNLRSAYNVGSIFRTADAAGLRRLYLCGITPTPSHPRVKKTALGAEKAIDWNYSPNALDTAMVLRAQGWRLWALECTSQSESLFAVKTQPGAQPANYSYPTEQSFPEAEQAPIVLVVGNEVGGVDPEVLALCERVLWIPMRGVKESLNVEVAFGIAVFHLIGGNCDPG